MRDFMLKTGPISIAVDALQWKTYKSGIFPASQCTGKIDHAVQAVGLNLEVGFGPCCSGGCWIELWSREVRGEGNGKGKN